MAFAFMRAPLQIEGQLPLWGTVLYLPWQGGGAFLVGEVPFYLSFSCYNPSPGVFPFFIDPHHNVWERYQKKISSVMSTILAPPNASPPPQYFITNPRYFLFRFIKSLAYIAIFAIFCIIDSESLTSILPILGFTFSSYFIIVIVKQPSPDSDPVATIARGLFFTRAAGQFFEIPTPRQLEFSQ